MQNWKTLAGLGAICAATALVMGGCKGIEDQEANKIFLKKLGDTSITVFPAVIRSREIKYDADAAKSIGDFLTAEKLAEVTVTGSAVPIPGPWHGNQARMLRESADAVAAYLKENPVQTEYVLLAEYLFDRESAGGVHCYILDAEGTVAYAALLNSHHKMFTDVNPKTVADCNEILLSVLRKDFGAGGSHE